MDEIWKDVPGYIGLYQVSNIGRVRSLPHTVRCYGGKRTSPGRIRKLVDYRGYKRVHLSRGAERHIPFVHRLVAEAFVPNPDNLPIINHKDENPANNRASNLEWCTVQYNCRYGTARRRGAETNKRRNAAGRVIHKPKLYTPVACYDLSGNFIRSFSSIKEASAETGVQKSGICNVCKGNNKKAGGMIWKYI